MKTAVEWLEDTLYPYLNKEDKEYTVALFNKAKQMEKNNLYECGSFWRGKENKIEKPVFEQWYNETFKSE